MARGTIFRFLILAALTAPLGAMAQSSDACSLLSAKEAEKSVGGLVPENFKSTSPASTENGHDHTTVCGWFPKSYKLATASAPPERGVQLTLHAFRTPAEAKAFHGHATEMTHEIAKSSPIPGKIAPAAGVGESALLEQKQLTGVQLATVQFLKGKVAGQVQLWRKDGSASDPAATIAKQVASKL